MSEEIAKAVLFDHRKNFWQRSCPSQTTIQNVIRQRNPFAEKYDGRREERNRERGTTIISDDRSREWSTRRGIMKTLRDLRRRRWGNFYCEVAVYLEIAIIPGATRYRKNDALSPHANASIKILKNRDEEERCISTCCVHIICIPCISDSINNMLLMIYRVPQNQCNFSE